MDSPPVRRPHVSRETRLLLTTAFLAVVALWLLARLRFPETSSTPTAVPPILAPLVAQPLGERLIERFAQPCPVE